MQRGNNIIMILHRHNILLALLELFNGELSPISFQKYLFLFIQECSFESDLYEFAPYRYGCFSFKANKDMRALEKQGYVVEIDNGKIYKLQGYGYIDALDMFEREQLFRFKKKFGTQTQSELVRYVYVNYPFFAIRSKMAKDVLTDEEYNNVQKFAEKFRKTEPALFTIGYEGLSLEKYIMKLIKEDVHILVDVRKNAYSMKYGFSKGILSKACENVCITYIHMPELGIESEFRKDLKTQEDYDNLFLQYEQTTLAKSKQQLIILRHVVEDGGRVALTCFEKDFRQCHRSRIAKQLMLMPNIQYKLTHL